MTNVFKSDTSVKNNRAVRQKTSLWRSGSVLHLGELLFGDFSVLKIAFTHDSKGSLKWSSKQASLTY